MTGVAKVGRRGSGERRRRTVSTRVRDAVALLLADKDTDIPQAAEAVGMTAKALRNALQTPGGRAYYLKALRSITDGSALKAARQLDTLIDGAASEYVRVDAAKFTLDRVMPRPEARVPLIADGEIRFTFITVAAQQARLSGLPTVEQKSQTGGLIIDAAAEPVPAPPQPAEETET